MTPWKPFYHNPNHRRLLGIIIFPNHLVLQNRSQLFLSESNIFQPATVVSHHHNHFHIWHILNWKGPQMTQPGLGGGEEDLHQILTLGWLSVSPVEFLYTEEKAHCCELYEPSEHFSEVGRLMVTFLCIFSTFPASE